jgi:hypothetical protein
MHACVRAAVGLIDSRAQVTLDSWLIIIIVQIQSETDTIIWIWKIHHLSFVVVWTDVAVFGCLWDTKCQFGGVR